MSKITKDSIIQILKSISAPGKQENIVDLGMVSSILIKDDSVGFAIEMQNLNRDEAEHLREKCEHEVAKLDGVKKVTVVLTADAAKSGNIRIGQRGEKKNVPEPPTPSPIAGVKNVILVASGKGGVGKSTIAVNMAITFGKLGFKTGLVDADIHGPSIARMMNIDKHQPEVVDNQIVPPESYGIKCMSMGFLLGEDAPVVWRGPMISKALYQLLRGARWDELDFLVIDLPPGTGDIHLSIAQNFSVKGAVVVTTSQDIAILDVKKCINMFHKVNIPILGIVENMSYFEEPDTGRRHYIFGKDKAENLAQAIKCPLLGSVPLNPVISEEKPIVISNPGHIISKTFANICGTINLNLNFEKTARNS